MEEKLNSTIVYSSPHSDAFDGSRLNILHQDELLLFEKPTLKMTHEQKAKELVEYFSIDNTSMARMYGKKFAIRAVDEMYNTLFSYLKDTNELQNADRQFAYLESVKKEIELL